MTRLTKVEHRAFGGESTHRNRARGTTPIKEVGVSRLDKNQQNAY